MNKATVYVFSSKACMALGFTMLSLQFKSREAAEKYVSDAMPEFFRIVIR
jgi:hypothetical protein